MVNYSLLQQVHAKGHIEPPPLTQFDLATVIDVLPVAVLLIGNNGLISHANPAAEALLDHPSAAQLVGLSWRHVVSDCFAGAGEHDLRLHNDRLVSLSTSAMPNSGQIIVLTDQTETRQLHQRMAHQQRLTAMGQMVASLAHQIRTPLSTATLYCSNLIEKDLSAAQQTKFLGKIRDRLQFLERHIRDMLVFSRGEIPLDDNSSVSQLMTDLAELAEEKLQAPLPIFRQQDAKLRCNRDILLGALMNLINNADEAGASDIQVYCKVDDQLEIQVRDDGPGMSPEFVDQLSDAFITTKSTGTGLGLAVVRAVAKAHLGSFSIQSVPGEGSVMTLSLPVSQQEST